VRGLGLSMGFEPPHPNPLPFGERARNEIVAALSDHSTVQKSMAGKIPAMRSDELLSRPYTFLVRISATWIGGTQGFSDQPTPLRATCTSSR
jgi:hypothetical protein